MTGDGEVHVCSREKEPELFDMVRCGLGQVAFITRVKTRLRRCQPMIRQYTLVYDELDAWMADAAKVLDPTNPTFSTAGGICTPAPLGFKKIGEGIELGKGMIGTALWLYPMYLTVEFAPGHEPDDAKVLAGLSPWRHPQTHGRAGRSSSRAAWSRCSRPGSLSGYWENPHPWMETTLPWETAKDYIETILSNLPPGALGSGGHVLLWPARTDTSQVPLFAHPPGRDGARLGDPRRGARPRSSTRCSPSSTWRRSSRSATAASATCPASSPSTPPSAGRAHFGDAAWERLRAAKKRWDPAGILGSGFIQYE